MKKPLRILAFSLLINAVLAALYLTRSDAGAMAGAPVSAVRKATPTAGALNRASATAVKAVGSPAGPAVAVNRSGPLNMAAARGLVARMRAGGFPEDMIRSTAQTQLMEQYQTRYAEIMGLNGPIPPFWSSEAGLSAMLMDPAKQQAQRELSKEMTAAMKDLLGPDYLTAGMSEETKAVYLRQYGDLPAEKIDQLQQLMEDFSMQQSEIYSTSVGGYSVRLPEDTAKLAQIEADRRAAIVALLSPQELENYDLRASNSASQLKSNLAAFEPSEDEYRTLFKLQQAFDEKYPNSLLSGAVSQDFLRERSQAQQQLKADMAAALPPDRAADYLLSQENGASTVARIVNRLELPMSTVGQVLAVQKDIQAQATAVRTDRTIPVEVRNQALAALQQQANEQIAGRIGTNGLAAYKSMTGSWIQNLVPPTPVPRGGAAPTPAAAAAAAAAAAQRASALGL